MSSPDFSLSSRAFARVDLTTAVALTLLLGVLTLPSLARTDTAGRAMRCLANHQRLTGAWQRFVSDNAGILPGNLDGGDAQNSLNASRTWCLGWLDFTSRPDNTNRFPLLNAQVGRYVEGDVSIYKCPADESTVRLGTRYVPRVRSVSMNSYMGERAYPYSQGFRQFRRLTEIVEPPPARAFVFLDERADSINDPVFFVEMMGSNPQSPGSYVIVDFPAAYHSGAGSFAFVDGHAELRRWRDPRTMPVLRPGQVLPLNVPSPFNQDVGWIQARTSSRPLR